MTADSLIVASDIDSHGLYGKLFRPVNHRMPPGIIVLGGSGGGLGWSEGMASQLAKLGYAALALAYFNYADLPKALLKIPLEYFAEAFSWMRTQRDIDTEHLTLVGGSRGSELALILGAKFPAVKAVVCYAPSSVVWGACGGFGVAGKPAWTFEGEPLLPMKPRFSFRVLYEHIKMGVCLISRAPPYRETPHLLRMLNNESAVTQAIIHAENIAGPILLISGDDDQLWPSTFMSEMIVTRLKRLDYPFSVTHMKYRGAGHAINLPDLPPEAYPTRINHPLTHMSYDLGGTPDLNAQAATRAWNEVVTFLQKQVMC